MLPNRPFSIRKVLTLVLAIVAAAFLANLFQPTYHTNGDALTVLTTVFSILAGFIIAVLAIVADERSLRGANWRQDVVYLELIKKDLMRHQAMFYLYLTVLVLAFVGAMKLTPAMAQEWIEWSVLFLAWLALLWSFRLPAYLTRRHLDSLERLIVEKRKTQVGS